jgi:acyl carrier protein
MLDTDIAALVRAQISDLLTEANGAVGPIADGDRLGELGLTSLLLARLIIQLESEIGVDPFAEDLAVSDVRTVGELTAAYRDTVAASAAVGA